MRYIFLVKVIKQLKKIRRRQPQLYREIQKQLELFETNENYNSLRNHKLTNNLKDYWSISVNENFRMLYLVDNETAVFVKIGTHDEVYEEN